MKNIGILILLLQFISLTGNAQNDSESEGKFELLNLFPTEVKYSGTTDFSKYYNGIYISKLFLGTTIRKEGFYGDGFNGVIELGGAYHYLNRNNFATIFPQIGGITWWGAHCFLRASPLYNLNEGRFDYMSTEIGFGLIASISFYCWAPIYNSNKFLFGFKLGFYLPNHLYFKEGRKNDTNSK